MTLPARSLLVLCMFLVSSVSASAEEYLWRFERTSDAMSWTAINALPERDAGGLTLMRQDDPFWLVSPGNLAISPELSYLEFRLKAPATYLLGYVMVKTRDNRSWKEEFQLGLPGAFHVYRIDLRRGNRTGAPIDSIAFAFGKVDRVSLDYVRIHRPTAFELLRIYWEDLWGVEYAGATTVNFISTPLFGGYPFLAPLYLLLLLIALCMIAAQRPFRAAAVRRSLMLSCIIAGTIFTVRMDYSWYMQWRADRASLGRVSVEERISQVDGTGAYDLARSVKQVVPHGERVRLHAGVLEGKLRYYLLPLKVSQRAGYHLVFRDPSVSFDPTAGALKRKDEVLAHNVKFIRAFGDEAFLYASSERAPR
jgi:hypothetical protein